MIQTFVWAFFFFLFLAAYSCEHFVFKMDIFAFFSLSYCSMATLCLPTLLFRLVRFSSKNTKETKKTIFSCICCSHFAFQEWFCLLRLIYPLDEKCTTKVNYEEQQEKKNDFANTRRKKEKLQSEWEITIFVWFIVRN